MGHIGASALVVIGSQLSSSSSLLRPARSTSVAAGAGEISALPQPGCPGVWPGRGRDKRLGVLGALYYFTLRPLFISRLLTCLLGPCRGLGPQVQCRGVIIWGLVFQEVGHIDGFFLVVFFILFEAMRDGDGMENGFTSLTTTSCMEWSWW